MALKKPSPFVWIWTAVMLFLLLWIAGCAWQNRIGEPTPTVSIEPAPTFTSPALPDLVIDQIGVETITPLGHCSGPDGIYQLRVTVANHGNGFSGAFVVRAGKDTQSAPAGLFAGGQMEIVFGWDPSWTRATVGVDPNFKVLESREDNNIFSGEVQIPDLPAACRQTPTPQVLQQSALLEMEGHTGRVTTVSFSPDGRLIASGSVDNTIRLWTAADGADLRRMQGHTFPILCLKFSPDGSRLISGSMDGVARTWQLSNSLLLSTLRGHAGWITSLDVSPNGQWLVTGSDDFTVRVWRLATSSLMQTIDEGMSSINSVAFSPDNSTVAWAESNGVVRVRTLAGEWLYRFEESASPAVGVIFLTGGQRLASAAFDGRVRIWNMDDGSLSQVVTTHAAAISALAASPDGAWLAVAAENGSIGLWRADEERLARLPVVIYAGHTGRVNSIQFSPDSTRLVSAGDDGLVRLWEMPAGMP